MKQGELRVLPKKYDGRSTFRVDEAAAILGISRLSAYIAVRERQIPSIRIGRRLIIPRAGLERMLAGA